MKSFLQLHRRLAILASLAVSLLELPSCASAPATIKRISHQLTGQQNLGRLLEDSLSDPSSQKSADALAHFVEQWKKQRAPENEGLVEIKDSRNGDRRYRVTIGPGGHAGYPLSYFDSITPAVDYKVRKLNHYRREGFGAPLVALRENRHRGPLERFYPPEAITRPLTAVIQKGPLKNGIQEVSIELLCPLRNDDYPVEGTRTPLAADFSVPWAALLSRAGELNRIKITDLLTRSPSRDPQLFLMEPYEPDKEPLIMIHGLLDTPLVWTELSNELWADDDIRSKYQLWHYLYNTSAPALYSGRVLREQLRELRKLLDPSGRDPAMKRTTIIAHSMGGIVSRSLTVRPKMTFWNAAFTQPLDSLKMSDFDRDNLREAFFWEPESHVRRIIYVAVPHRGSHFADNPVGRLGRWLISPPNRFEKFYQQISSANPGAFTPAYARLGEGRLDSVHALSPEQPTLRILAELPNAFSVEEHSIIGNRGRKGPLEESSDGVVPYWSSHLDRAQSERIVPSGHGAVEHPETLTEIKRILKSR